MAVKKAAPKKAAPKKAAPKVETITLRQLGTALADAHEIPKKQAAEVLEDFVEMIRKHLKKGAKIRIGGLGILQVRKRPARMGRNATAFTPHGRLRLRNAACREDPRPVQPGCDCLACRLYSRSYLNHLFRCREMLGPILLSIHNIRFYHRMMADARQAIREGKYHDFCDEFLSRYLKGKDGQ